MAILLTGSTGYIGAHIAANLLADSAEPLNLLVRARDEQEARERLWRSLQLHLDFPSFREYLDSRIRIFRGDLTDAKFGLADDGYAQLVQATDSVIHCAASLNRKSEKSCLNVNLRGTLEVIQLAQRARDHHGLRRFSHVSTVAVAGQRSNEVVQEDSSIDWARSDYDPYARTKKFCEHMVHQLLPDVQRTIFRPSIVLGDSRRPETNQFEMVRAFVFLAGLPVLPFRPTDKIDIVNVDFVAGAVAMLHQKPNPEHTIYHLSSGTNSETFSQLTDALAKATGKRGPMFVPKFEKSTSTMVNALAGKAGKIGGLANLLKVFLPYLVWNTVFDNTRATTELGIKPVPFSEYSYPLLRFSRENHFVYKYRDWPADSAEMQAARHASAVQDLGQ
ncbi:MAG: SDR family oxidoreductase [Candidatus Acidiferrales bacterium]